MHIREMERWVLEKRIYYNRGHQPFIILRVHWCSWIPMYSHGFKIQMYSSLDSQAVVLIFVQGIHNWKDGCIWHQTDYFPSFIAIKATVFYFRVIISHKIYMKFDGTQCADLERLCGHSISTATQFHVSSIQRTYYNNISHN